ncbi:DUF1830 domain-containing protein [Stanieria cyanosphaera]|nr:DUF1830 domain-containing protein [Stanieria cyanosphaera]
MLCYYINPTNKIQLIRVIKDRHLNQRSDAAAQMNSVVISDFEKIIFPQQRILFEAMPEAQLEIYYSQGKNPKIAQTIPCQNLKVNCPTVT